MVARLLLDLGAPGSNPGRIIFYVMLIAIFFFYLSTILAYSLSYFSYYINFRKYLKLTKVKSCPCLVSNTQPQRGKKFANRVLKLRTLALLGQCLTMLNCKAICNSVRTTILHLYFKSLSSGKSRNRVIA